MSPGKAMVAKQGVLLTSPILVLPFESPDAFETSDEFALLCPALLLLAGCAVEGLCTCTLSVTPGSVNVVAELFIPEDSGVDASQAESQFVALEDDTPAELSDTLGTTVESISGSVSLQTGVTRLVQVNAPPPPSAPQSAPLSTDESDQATSGTAAVAGGVAGGVVFAMLVAGVLYCRWRSGQRRRSTSKQPAFAAKKAEANVSAVTIEIPKAPSRMNTFSIKLEEHGLTQYADALGEQGYSSMASFKNMTSEEAGALADRVKMKPDHKRAFIRAFTAVAEDGGDATETGSPSATETPGS